MPHTRLPMRLRSSACRRTRQASSVWRCGRTPCALEITLPWWRPWQQPRAIQARAPLTLPGELRTPPRWRRLGQTGIFENLIQNLPARQSPKNLRKSACLSGRDELREPSRSPIHPGAVGAQNAPARGRGEAVGVAHSAFWPRPRGTCGGSGVDANLTCPEAMRGMILTGFPYFRKSLENLPE